MNAVQRREAFVLIEFRSTVPVQQLALSIFVVVGVSVFWPVKRRIEFSVWYILRAKEYNFYLSKY